MPENEQKKLSDLKGQIKRLEREAQIEAALERIRARTMAMHKSDELTEIALVLWEQFGDLQLADVEGCAIHVFTDYGIDG